MELVAFSLLSFISVWAAIKMITARKVVYSVFWLLLSFFTTACIFLLLNAEFLAIVQILVNAGAVVISFLFVVILINLREESFSERYYKNRKLATLIVILMFVFLGIFLIPQGRYLQKSADLLAMETTKWGGNSELIAKSMFTDHIVPFEIVGIVLLVAVVGVVVLAKKASDNEKVE